MHQPADKHFEYFKTQFNGYLSGMHPIEQRYNFNRDNVPKLLLDELLKIEFDLQFPDDRIRQLSALRQTVALIAESNTDKTLSISLTVIRYINFKILKHARLDNINFKKFLDIIIEERAHQYCVTSRYELRFHH